MAEAKQNESRELEWQAQIEMMKLFKTRDQYEHTMKMYEEYQKQKEEYQKMMEQLEQQSINYERMMKQKQHEEKMKKYKLMFGEDF